MFPLLQLLITGFQGVDGKVKIGSYYSSIGLRILNKPSQDGDGPLTVRQTSMCKSVQFDHCKN